MVITTPNLSFIKILGDYGKVCLKQKFMYDMTVENSGEHMVMFVNNKAKAMYKTFHKTPIRHGHG